MSEQTVTGRRYLRAPRDGKGRFEAFDPDPDLLDLIDQTEYPLPDGALLTADWAYGWEPITHELTSQHRVDQFGRNEYWVTCTCGWKSRPCIFPHEAVSDSLDHQGRRT